MQHAPLHRLHVYAVGLTMHVSSELGIWLFTDLVLRRRSNASTQLQYRTLLF
jgi:hypothetical protein